MPVSSPSMHTQPWRVVRTWLPVELQSPPVTVCRFCRRKLQDADLVVCVIPARAPLATAVVHDDCLNDPGCLIAIGGACDPRERE